VPAAATNTIHSVLSRAIEARRTGLREGEGVRVCG
jgi:hypothetical protein